MSKKIKARPTPSHARRSIKPSAAKQTLQSSARVIFWCLLALCIDWQVPVHVRPAHIDAVWHPPSMTQATIILLGDTGLPGPELERLRATVLGEKKDLIIALGDLIYPYGPICSKGALTGTAKKIYDERLGHFYNGLGATTLMVLGNHEVRGQRRDEGREACFFDYAASAPSLYFPALSYQVDLGVILISVINTNDLTAESGVATRAAFDATEGWRLLIGHHVLRAFHDKAREDVVFSWLHKHGLRPDLYANGHAHLQQFGVYEGIPALTTGATSKLRERPSCPPDCGDGQLWGRSVRGYAVLEVNAKRMQLTVKDIEGATLWTRTISRQKDGD